MIEIRGLRVSYGRTLALDSIDLLLRPGITGLFGPNGAGKSTLLRVTAGLLAPTAGSVTLDGYPLNIRNEGQRGQIAYVGHDAGLYAHLSVAENLELFATMYAVPRSRIGDAIESVGLGERAATRVGQLSAGLLRRAAIARALLHDPALLLLDEPYANLDDEASEYVTQALVAWRAPQRYALIATHGAKRVRSYADASVILQRGNVVSYRVRSEETQP